MSSTLTHWHHKPLGEVCDLIGGGTPSKKNESFYTGDIAWATVRDMKNSVLSQTEFKITEEAVKNSSTNIIKSNNVVIATRVGLGKVCLINQDTAINQDLRAVVPKKSNQLTVRFLFWWMKSIAHLIEKEGTGATVKGVKLPFVKGLQIPLPPLPEQKRIVTILDKAFEGINQAISNAEKNLVNARALFESYLNNVFTQKGDGWEEEKLEEVTTLLGDGLHGTPKYTDNGEYHFINGNNLNNGKIEFKERTKRVSFEEYGKYKKNLNDRTVFVSINGTLGKVAFYNNEKIILGKSACYFNLINEIDKTFIKYVVLSPQFKKYLNSVATGATIKNVSLKSMRNYQLSFPTLARQQAIVGKIDDLSGRTQHLESIYQQKLNNLQELKKSILQKAFSGELTTDTIH